MAFLYQIAPWWTPLFFILTISSLPLRPRALGIVYNSQVVVQRPATFRVMFTRTDPELIKKSPSADIEKFH